MLRRNEFEQIQWRRKKAVLLATALGAVVALVFLAIGQVIFSPLIYFLLLRYFYGRLQGRMVIVWLRRFHQPKRRAVRFKRGLAAAAARIAVPVTIQDTSIRFEHEAGFLYSYSAAHWMLIAVVLVVLFAANSLSPHISDNLAGFLLQIAAVIAVGGIVLFALIRRRGVIRLCDNLAIPQAKYLLGRLRDPHIDLPEEARGQDDDTPYENLSRAVPLSEVLIVQTSDAVWQNVVIVALQNADFVVIDVTDVRTNILWELRTAAQMMAPGSIILTYAYRGQDTNAATDAITARLIDLLGTEFLKHCRSLPYPEVVRGLRARWAAQKAFVERLRGFLLERAKQIPARLH